MSVISPRTHDTPRRFHPGSSLRSARDASPPNPQLLRSVSTSSRYAPMFANVGGSSVPAGAAERRYSAQSPPPLAAPMRYPGPTPVTALAAKHAAHTASFGVEVVTASVQLPLPGLLPPATMPNVTLELTPENSSASVDVPISHGEPAHVTVIATGAVSGATATMREVLSGLTPAGWVSW